MVTVIDGKSLHGILLRMQMNPRVRPCVEAAIFSLALLISSACTSYQPAGLSGGFSETRLSQTSFQVHFRGNSYTSAARVEKFMLRRGAELALENGYRYFTIDAPQNLDRRDLFGFYSERGVTVRFFEAATAETADAVIVIAETDELAGGKLSPKARETLSLLSGK
jgi:hypothetical protein